MLKKWRQCLSNRGVSETLLTDLSNAFDCILQELLIAKLAAYGFDYNSLQMLQSYLSNRTQRTKTNDACSKYCEILFGVSQGSILGPLLFNIYTCDMFYDINDCDIASYADHYTSYASSSNLDALISKLESHVFLIALTLMVVFYIYFWLYLKFTIQELYSCARFQKENMLIYIYLSTGDLFCCK